MPAGVSRLSGERAVREAAPRFSASRVRSGVRERGPDLALIVVLRRAAADSGCGTSDAAPPEGRLTLGRGVQFWK